MLRKLFIVAFFALHLYALEPFLKPKDLYNLLDDPRLVIIDLSGKENYKLSHIDNALHLENTNLLSKSTSHPSLVSSQELENINKALGITPDSKIVLYTRNTDNDFLNASLGAYAFLSQGFENVAILEGGYLAWAFTYPLLISSQSTPKPKSTDFSLACHKTFDANETYLQEHEATTTFLDVRSAELYFGIAPSKSSDKFGHIPHAINAYYRYNFFNDNTLREKNELEELYIKGLGLHHDDTVIVYGENVYDASMSWFILYKHLGFTNAKIYESGISGWMQNNEKSEPVKYKWETKKEQ